MNNILSAASSAEQPLRRNESNWKTELKFMICMPVFSYSVLQGMRSKNFSGAPSVCGSR